MNESEIRSYAKLMKELGLTGIEINEQTGYMRLEMIPGAGLSYRGVRPDHSGYDAALSAAGDTAYAPEAQKTENPAAASTADKDRDEAVRTVQSGNAGTGRITTVSSPTVGVFYAAPQENADPYVNVGDTVRKGDVLCIIETMKLMNEITAEEDGVIDEILVKNGQIVEYGTELFKIRETR